MCVGGSGQRTLRLKLLVYEALSNLLLAFEALNYLKQQVPHTACFLDPTSPERPLTQPPFPLHGQRGEMLE